MLTDHWDRLFATASQTWNLPKLYADLEAVAGKPLKPHEKPVCEGCCVAIARGDCQRLCLDCRCSAGGTKQGTVSLYREFDGQSVNSLRWEKVSEWLELKGYKLQTPAPPTPTPCIDWGTAPEISLFFGALRI
jgi:hypothetical protein